MFQFVHTASGHHLVLVFFGSCLQVFTRRFSSLLNSLQQLRLSLAVGSPKLGDSRGLTCALRRCRMISLNLLATLGLTAAQGTASYPYGKNTVLGHIQISVHQNSLVLFLKNTPPVGEFPPCTGV